MTSIEDLTLHRGVFTNFGSFNGGRATINQGASFVNGGHSTIETLRGQGLFLNHGHFDGLVQMSILRFINRNNAFFAQRAESHFEEVSVAGVTSQFLNDEGALIEANRLAFERHRPFRPSAVQNNGDVLVHEGITLQGRNFLNNGTATLTEIDLQNHSHIINREDQSIGGVRSLRLSEGSSVRNTGTFSTEGVVPYAIFMLLANQEAGHWNHEGDVHLDEERITTTGSISLNNGVFLVDVWRSITSRGNLELNAWLLCKSSG